MKIRFYNARIMAMQDGVSIQKGELWTKDDRIRMWEVTKIQRKSLLTERLIVKIIC